MKEFFLWLLFKALNIKKYYFWFEKLIEKFSGKIQKKKGLFIFEKVKLGIGL
jgi:hypothetical protein